MKFIVDECTGTAVVEYLRENGHDVVSVAETIPQCQDKIILNRAVHEQRILITNDKDFGDLIFRRGLSHHGVLLLRLQDNSATNRVRVVRAVFDRYSDVLKSNFLVATERRVRVRYLPNLPDASAR